MRCAIKLSLGLACLCAMLASSEAFAKPRRDASGAPTSSGQGFDVQIPLPGDLTSNKDFLVVGEEAPVGSTDRYFVEQQDFANSDPLRYTESGSLLDSLQ